MDYTVITAWFDVRRQEDHPLKNETDHRFFKRKHIYLEAMKTFFSKPFPMIIFTEPEFVKTITDARPPEYLTHIIVKTFDQLYLYDHFPKFEENHHKRPIENLCLTKFTALYKFMVQQKVFFMKEAIELNPFQTKQFAWMDMCLHRMYDAPIEETTLVMSEIPEDKIKIMQMSFVEPVDNRNWFYERMRGKIAAGFFAGCAKPLLQFAELCHKELLRAMEEGAAPTDEMVYAVVVSHHYELFSPYVGDYIDCLKNQRVVRNSLHLVFRFLQTVFDRGMHSYVTAVSEGIRRGYREKAIELSAEQIHQAWYYSYKTNVELYCDGLWNEYMAIGKEREDVALYIRPVRMHLGL